MTVMARVFWVLWHGSGDRSQSSQYLARGGTVSVPVVFSEENIGVVNMQRCALRGGLDPDRQHPSTSRDSGSEPVSGRPDTDCN